MSVLEKKIPRDLQALRLQSLYAAIGRIRSRLDAAPPYITDNPIQAEADLRWCLDVLEKILRKASKGLSSPGV